MAALPAAGFIDRYSRVTVVRASIVDGALGIGPVIFVDSDWVAGVSVILWGLGASLGFPRPFPPPAMPGYDAPTRVSVVATTGYLAFLVGPPLLGYLENIMVTQRHDGCAGAGYSVAALVAKAVAKPVSTPQPVMEHNA